MKIDFILWMCLWPLSMSLIRLNYYRYNIMLNNSFKPDETVMFISILIETIIWLFVGFKLYK